MSSIDRPAHALVREKTLAIPRHMILFDTETNMETTEDGSTVHTLRLGWAVYFRRAEGRKKEVTKWLYFTDADTFWAWVFSFVTPKQKLWVIAHNINFDFTIVNGWAFLRSADYKCRFFYNNGMTTIISVRKPGSSVVFVDTLNWFPESLEKLGERAGVPKLKIDFSDTTDEYLSTYCKRDTEILLVTMKNFIRFLRGNNIARLCYTIGSTAMAAFLKGCYNSTIYIHNNREAIDLERDSYRGGRTECFFLGDLEDGEYTFLDINSLYPSVMCSCPYPIKYSKCGSVLTHADLGHLLEGFSVVANVTIETPDPVFAIKRKRLLFPIGRFRATLCSPELRYALEHNMIREIGRHVIYEQAHVFSTYVNKFYALRQDFKSANVPMYDHFCKILLNCLYGKFGQKAEQWSKVGDCPNEPDRVEDLYDTSGGGKRKLRYLLGEIFELTGYTESFNSFPAIASHVTAFARMQLWELMQQAGSGHYFYCDTDSLLVDNVGLDRLADQIDPTALGKLKIESVNHNVTIYGAKDYVTDAKSASKGIRADAVRLDTGVYSQDRWPSLQGLLRSNDATSYKVSKVVKHLQRNYQKGTVTPEGLVVPYVLSDVP